MIHCGDSLAVLKTVPSESVDCCITSPPYYNLRDYGVQGQVGLEPSVQEYVARLVMLFEEVRRVLKPTGTLWLNLGDSFGQSGRGGASYETSSLQGGLESHNESKKVKRPRGSRPKQLLGTPWRVAFALQDAGWILRSDIIWAKPNPMPESVRDRPTRAHEFIFLFAKEPKYFYDSEASKEPASGRSSGRKNTDKAGDGEGFEIRSGFAKCGEKKWDVRNPRDVWTISSKPFKGAHFAVFPEALVERCMKAGIPTGGTALDPFAGSGTVGVVAKRLGRDFIGIELNPAYVAMAEKRIAAS